MLAVYELGPVYCRCLRPNDIMKWAERCYFLDAIRFGAMVQGGLALS